MCHRMLRHGSTSDLSWHMSRPSAEMLLPANTPEINIGFVSRAPKRKRNLFVDNRENIHQTSVNRCWTAVPIGRCRLMCVPRQSEVEHPIQADKPDLLHY
jgi:hypothetical protein